jgi:hypothetical protein
MPLWVDVMKTSTLREPAKLFTQRGTKRGGSVPGTVQEVALSVLSARHGDGWSTCIDRPEPGQGSAAGMCAVQARRGVGGFKEGLLDRRVEVSEGTCQIFSCDARFKGRFRILEDANGLTFDAGQVLLALGDGGVGVVERAKWERPRSPQRKTVHFEGQDAKSHPHRRVRAKGRAVINEHAIGARNKEGIDKEAVASRALTGEAGLASGVLNTTAVKKLGAVSPPGQGEVLPDGGKASRRALKVPNDHDGNVAQKVGLLKNTTEDAFVHEITMSVGTTHEIHVENVHNGASDRVLGVKDAPPMQKSAKVFGVGAGFA